MGETTLGSFYQLLQLKDQFGHTVYSPACCVLTVVLLPPVSRKHISDYAQDRIKVNFCEGVGGPPWLRLLGNRATSMTGMCLSFSRDETLASRFS